MLVLLFGLLSLATMFLVLLFAYLTLRIAPSTPAQWTWVLFLTVWMAAEAWRGMQGSQPLAPFAERNIDRSARWVEQRIGSAVFGSSTLSILRIGIAVFWRVLLIAFVIWVGFRSPATE